MSRKVFPLRAMLKASLMIQVSLLFLYGCESSRFESFQGKAQGTTYHVTLEVPEHLTAADVQQQLEKRLAEIDKSLSTYRPDSEISRFNQQSTGESLTVSDDFIKVIEISQYVFQNSNGAFDLTVKPLIDLWGFGSKVSLKHFESVPADADIQKAIRELNFAALSIKGNTITKSSLITIDVNGVAQGYSVDALHQLLKNMGVLNYMIELGGEIATHGHNPKGKSWHIGIDWPESSSNKRVYSTLLLNDNFVSTSGDYRDYYEIKGKRYSHTIDPRTGKPVEHRLASVTVLASSVALADAWCTAFMVLGDNVGFELANKMNMPAYFIYRSDQGFQVKITKAMQPFLVE